MAINTYGVALRYGKGSIVRRTRSSDAQGAKDCILGYEHAPESAVIETYRWFEDMNEVRQAVTAGGSHWFDADTLRFFRTRLSRDLYAGRYFVTSEENPSGERRYSVRKVVLDGRGLWQVETVGGFMQYASRSGAHNAARKAAFSFELAAA